MPKNHTCDRYRVRGAAYASGVKRCTICSVYMDYSGTFCPCCNTKLRTKPRARRYKEKLRYRQGLS